MRIHKGFVSVCLAFSFALATEAADDSTLQKMRDAGVLSEDEFQRMTAEAISQPKKTRSMTPVMLALGTPVALPWGSDWDVCGLGVGFLFLRCHDLSGVGIAQDLCWVDGKLSGVQIGIVNFARKGAGLQLGGLNFCDDLCGVQIGVINYSAKSSVPVLPILNMCF